MTEVYIDGVAAVLSKEFSIQVKRENPLFTKNGEYTYDITLPLDNSTNAALYSHLNRLNSVAEVKSDRKAILVADNRVYCNGTEVITGWTEKTVSVQITSGNSELNWLIGADKLISELEFNPARIDTEDNSRPNEGLLDLAWPESEFCFPEIRIDSTGEIINQCRWETASEAANVNEPLIQRPRLPQPYLCAYIRRIIAALGYTLEWNQIEQTTYSCLFVANLYGRNWADVSPGWTVMDFLEEVERMFNCTFVIDSRKKTARLLANAAYFAGSQTQHVRWVEDVYETEIEEDNELTDYENTRIGYAFPETDYWKLNRLEDGYVEQAEPQEIPADYQPEISLFARINNYIVDNRDIDTDTLLHDGTNEAYALLHTRPAEGQTMYTEFYVMDRFAPVNREAEDSLELTFLPVMTEIAEVLIEAETAAGAGSIHTNYIRAAVEEASADSTEEENPEEGQAEIDKILNWEDPDEPSACQVYIGFYDRPDVVTYTFADSDSSILIKFPYVWIDQYVVLGTPYNGTFAPVRSASLRPAELAKTFWQGSYNIRYDQAVKLSSHDPNLYDPAGIFEIRNRRYVCREMEFTLDANGRKGAWTGTFYPISISDTEADARWILADGKWRDGGVWLDNGRWLDE